MATHTVLIIEDESAVRKVLTNELRKHTIEVHEAENGEEALALARRVRPQVILLDFLMPKMHGLDFMQELQKEEWWKKTSVIVLTNLPDEPHLVALEKKGLCKILSKSTASLDEVISEVKKRF